MESYLSWGSCLWVSYVYLLKRWSTVWCHRCVATRWVFLHVNFKSDCHIWIFLGWIWFDFSNCNLFFCFVEMCLSNQFSDKQEVARYMAPYIDSVLCCDWWLSVIASHSRAVRIYHQPWTWTWDPVLRKHKRHSFIRPLGVAAITQTCVLHNCPWCLFSFISPSWYFRLWKVLYIPAWKCFLNVLLLFHCFIRS